MSAAEATNGTTMDRTPQDLARILRNQAARLTAAADELDPRHEGDA